MVVKRKEVSWRFRAVDPPFSVPAQLSHDTAFGHDSWPGALRRVFGPASRIRWRLRTRSCGPYLHEVNLRRLGGLMLDALDPAFGAAFL